MSELEFLTALHVELLRHVELRPGGHPHELFQLSTIEALLGGAFEGDTNVGELLEHGDLGLGTLNGLDGELVIIDGEAWKANADCTLVRASEAWCSPYAVVVPFSPGSPVILHGPLQQDGLELATGHQLTGSRQPVAVRIDGDFDRVRVRSIPKQQPPYPQLATALAQQRISDLSDVSGVMVGFGFPDAVDGIEMIGWHLHFATEDRTRGGHVLGFTLREGAARLDDATDLHVELPPAVDVHRDAVLDQAALRRLESER